MMKRLTGICFILMLFFAGCSKEEEVTFFADNQLEALQYIPSGAQFVLYMNIEKLRKTDYWEEYILSSMLKREEAEIIGSLEKDLNIGFDNISDLYFSTGERDEKYILLNTGRSNNHFSSLSFNSNSYKGKKFYAAKSKPGLFIYETGSSFILLSNNENYIRSVIDDNVNSVQKDENYFNVLKGIPDKKSYWICTNKQRYAAGVVERVFKDAGPFKKVLRTINNITVCADFDRTVLMQSVLGCKDAGSAGLLVTGIKSALVMGVFNGKDERLGEILDKLDISRSGKNIFFDLELNKQDLKNLKIITDKKNLEEKL